MAGQKRKELLTKTEKERLITRRDMKDSKKRIANDARVKKKLSAWLKNVPDILLILKELPDEQKRPVVEDVDIFGLLGLTIDMMKTRNFRRLHGDPENPASWETIAPDIWEHPVPGPGLVQASDIDIARSAELAPLIRSLMTLVNVGSDPVFDLPSVQDPTMQKVLEKHPEIIKKYEASEGRLSTVRTAYRADKGTAAKNK
jgi:hypothetical protein